MAKFGRFDSRNKKRGKHKQQSQDRDFKIKNVNKTSKYKLNAKIYDEKNYIQEQEAF
jgi:hypothetical protein